MDGLTVQRAGVDDATTLARLLWDFDTEFDTPVDDVGVLTTRFARLLELDAVAASLATTPTAAVGFALTVVRPAIWFDGPVAHLDELYVVPGLRDRRIGTALLAHALAEVRERGAAEMHINVDEVDADTRRFYERHGFVTIESDATGRMLCYVGPTA